MRWPVVLVATVIATVAFADEPMRMQPGDLGSLIAQHRADARAIALARLAAAHGNPRIRVLGRHIVHELGFADAQVIALARQHGVVVDPRERARDRVAQDRLFRVAALDGLAFDRAVLAALDDELALDLEWLDAHRSEPRDGTLVTLLATMQPSFVRYRAEVDWVAQLVRPAQ
jgi:hypothetical protein